MISLVYITLPYDAWSLRHKARTFLIESLLLIILKRLKTALSYSNIAKHKTCTITNARAPIDSTSCAQAIISNYALLLHHYLARFYKTLSISRMAD